MYICERDKVVGAKESQEKLPRTKRNMRNAVRTKEFAIFSFEQLIDLFFFVLLLLID